MVVSIKKNSTYEVFNTQPMEVNRRKGSKRNKISAEFQKKINLRCLSNVKCCGDLCTASPASVARVTLGFVSSLSISNHMIKGYSSALKKQQQNSIERRD